MRKSLNITGLLLLLAIAGCRKEVQELQKDYEPVAAAKASGTSTPAVYLRVKVDPIVAVEGDTTAKIRSDYRGTHNGDYLHGLDRVEAQVMSSDGHFYMNTNNNTVKEPLRTMRFLLDNSPVAMTGQKNYSLRTTPLSDEPAFVWLQNMYLGQVQYVGLRAWGLQDRGIVEWRLQYRTGPQDEFYNQTVKAKVTKTATGWVIEPHLQEGQTAANAVLRDGATKPNPIGNPIYQVPFRFELTKL